MGPSRLQMGPGSIYIWDPNLGYPRWNIPFKAYEYGTRRTEPICKRRSHMHMEYAVCPTVPPEHCAPSSFTTVALLCPTSSSPLPPLFPLLPLFTTKWRRRRRVLPRLRRRMILYVTITLPPGPRPRPLLKYTKRTHRWRNDDTCDRVNHVPCVLGGYYGAECHD